MQVIRDALSSKGLIEGLMKRYGRASEDNYYCYLNNIEHDEEPYIVLFDDGIAVLAKYDLKENMFWVFREVMAPAQLTGSIVKRFLDHVYSLPKKPKKVWFELETITRKLLMRELEGSGYRSNSINYTLVWPVFEMSKWDGERMEGGEWKNMRYYWNKFFREHTVEFKTCADVDKEEMRSLVRLWKEKRNGTDKTYIEYYMHAIDSNFAGYDVNRIMVVDGKVAAISAGFAYSSDYQSGYYSSIGLYNPDIERANDIANMDDLINLKRLGYNVVDFGGVEAGPLEFKKKFMPTRYYKTYVFSVVKLEERTDQKNLGGETMSDSVRSYENTGEFEHEGKFLKLTSSADCFSCRLCCLFLNDADDMAASPLFTQEERDDANKLFPDTQNTHFNYLHDRKLFQARLVPYKKDPDTMACSFLNQQTHECRIYSKRPFDCRIWPYIIIRDKDGRIEVRLYTKEYCPSMQKRSDETITKYNAYFMNWLKARYDMLRKNPGLILDYADDYFEMTYNVGFLDDLGL